MDAVEENAPETAADCQSAVFLRTRLIELSNYLKAHKSKVDEKTRVLREEVAKEEG
jgi:phosphatidylinositol 3-kinase